MKIKSLSNSVAWYGMGNLFIRSVSFILLPLYSNLISTAEFGNYALLMSVYTIASVIYQLGMHGSLNKFYIEAKTEERKKLIFSSIINSILLFGIVVTIFLSLFSDWLSVLIFETSEFSSLLVLIFVSLLFETLTFYILFLLKTKELSKKVVAYSGIGAIINLCLNILFVYYLRLSVAGIILAQLISAAILLLVMLNVIKDEYVLKLDQKIFKNVIKFSLPLVAAGILSSAVDVADRFILNYYLGKDEVGIYSFAYRIAMVMNVFVISFRTAWSPYSLNLFYSRDYKSSFGKTLTKMVALSGVILLVVSLFGDYLFDIKFLQVSMFNQAYKAGMVILPLVIIGYIFSGISSFYSVYPYISNKSYHFLYADLLSFLINVALNFILIPWLGIIGAAFATAIGFLVGAAYLFFISRDQIKIDYQTKKLTVIIMTSLMLLLIGLNLKNIFLDLSLVIIYMGILQYLVKLDLTKLLKRT